MGLEGGGGNKEENFNELYQSNIQQISMTCINIQHFDCNCVRGYNAALLCLC